MKTVGAPEEIVVPGMPYETEPGAVALCFVDQTMGRNVAKVFAVLMNPCDPRLDDHLFRDGLAKTLNLLVVEGVLPNDLGYPYNITNGPAFLEKVSAGMRLGLLEVYFPNLPEAIKEKLHEMARKLTIDAHAELSPAGLQMSPNWQQFPDTIQNSLNLKADLPHEEFPKGGHHGDGKRFEIITNDGEKHIAHVDYSAQYRSEGKQWRIISSDTLMIRDSVDKYQVIAWREV